MPEGARELIITHGPIEYFYSLCIRNKVKLKQIRLRNQLIKSRLSSIRVFKNENYGPSLLHFSIFIAEQIVQIVQNVLIVQIVRIVQIEQIVVMIWIFNKMKCLHTLST